MFLCESIGKAFKELLLLYLCNNNYFSAVFSAVQISPSIPKLTWQLNILLKGALTLLRLPKTHSDSS